MISHHTQGLHKITYLTLAKLTTKELCIPVVASTIPVPLLTIQISARYQRPQLLPLLLLILAIPMERNLKRRDGGIIGRLGVTEILCFLMERDVWIVFYGTAMTIQFGLGVLPTTVNIMAMTALHRIMNPLLLNVDMSSLVVVLMFDVWIFH